MRQHSNARLITQRARRACCDARAARYANTRADIRAADMARGAQRECGGSENKTTRV